MDIGSGQCEVWKVYLLFNIYMFFILFVCAHCFFQIFKPTQITWSYFIDTIAPFDKTKNKNTTHWLPHSLFQESLQRITPILYVIDLIDSMDCCSPLEFPKSEYSLLKSKTTKFRYKQNINIDSWKELLTILKTCRTFHHSHFSTIIPSFNIDVLPF